MVCAFNYAPTPIPVRYGRLASRVAYFGYCTRWYRGQRRSIYQLPRCRKVDTLDRRRSCVASRMVCGTINGEIKMKTYIVIIWGVSIPVRADSYDAAVRAAIRENLTEATADDGEL